MGSQLSWSQQRGPSCLAWTKSVVLLEGFAPPECLCSFHGRSVSLMEPELRFLFLFFPLPHPNTCPHCSLAPRDSHINKRGDLLECSPKGTSKEQLSWWDWINGIWVITALTVRVCERGYRQIVCAHACMLSMCLTRGFDQGWAEIHVILDSWSAQLRQEEFCCCFFLNPLGSQIFLGLGDLEWKSFVLTFFFFLLCLIALLFSSGNRTFR